MRKTAFNLLACGVIALSLTLSGAKLASNAAVGGMPTTMEELKVDRLKVLSKRDPRAEELANKASAYVEKQKQANADPIMVARLQKTVEEIIFGSSSLSDPAIKADMEVLEAIGKEHKEPSAADLAPLQDRYKKVCEHFDDKIFTKDLERAFHIHDKFVRYTSLGLWDKDKIASELERMEGLIERAPDIAFGKAQLYDTCKNKHLVSVPKLVYVGTAPHEQMYLTTDRRSANLVDTNNMELAEFVIQAPDGKFNNFNDCNNPAVGMPFSPPLTLWAKSRILEAHVPAIMLNFVDSDITLENPNYKGAKASFANVADVAEGKLDDYLKANMKLIGTDKTPALIGLGTDFDRTVASTAFGADGHTPYWQIVDPKLKDMPEERRAEEIKKRQEKGTFAANKANPPELSNQYGDKAIPDGPERVRDAWKRLSKITAEVGGGSIGQFCSAGSFHGNKNATKYERDAGNQPWNKLEYYWPGEGVMDWVGINAVGDDPTHDPKGANIMEALDAFMNEARTSSWQATPVMLVDLSPSRAKNPFEESAWIKTVFTTVIPATFPNILGVFVGIPDEVTLWTPEARSAYRSYVTSNKFYNFKFRFKDVK